MFVPEDRVTLAPDARQDYSDILLYTETRWGPDQADRYAAALTDAISSIGHFPQIGEARPGLGRGIRALPVERHVIYYRVIEARVEVIRIRHQRMGSASWRRR